MIRLEKDDFGTLAICAIRYCHGRETYMPDLVRGIIKPHLKELSNKDLNVMIDDCDYQERMELYGDPYIDMPGWLRWKADLIAEKKRRTDEQDMPTGKWIPCSERLPEENGLYLVTNVGRWVEPVGTRYYNIRADGGFWSGHPGDKVLAWMPLPKPYVDDIPNEYFESGGK